MVHAVENPSLTPELIVAAYCRGIFPMADEDGDIGWYSPDPRAVFPLDAFHVPRSLAKTIRRGTFEVRVDTAFEAVMRGCADRDLTWISEEIVRSYTALHRVGLAHSVEAWREGRLVGGLYGVSLGGAFMGESMFSRETDASKVCLVFLVERLRERGYVLLDSQMATEHLARFGQIEIPRREYLRQLRAALKLDRTFA
jgi:leucyl/phenylalanyl-tRNA--protein transferase